MTHIRSILYLMIITSLVILVFALIPKMTIAQDSVLHLEDSVTGSAFTYQGYLEENGLPANGSYNFRFYLWSDQVKTTLLGIFPTADTLPVNLVDGNFSAELDFGGDVFNGQEIWLEIEVNGESLSPLQRLTATPYAMSLRPGAVINGTVSAPAGMLNLNNASGGGLLVDHAGGDGIRICSTGFDTSCTTNGRNNGIEIGSTQGYGIYVDDAGDQGLYINNAGEDGVVVYSAVDDGLRVSNAGDDGVQVSSAVDSGVYIAHAGGSGITICSTGSHSSCDLSSWPLNLENGITLGDIDGMAIVIDRADRGLYVVDAGQVGAQIYSERDGIIAIGDEVGDGVGDGIVGGKSGDDAEWGIITPDQLYAGGGVSTNSLAMIAQVGGDQPIFPGDVVNAIGVADPLPENLQSIPLVGFTSSETTTGIIGVVKARMERLAVPLSPEEEKQGVEQRYTLRSVEGPAQPGDYVAITVLGVAEVKVAPGVDIQPGQRLTASDLAGRVRPLYTRTVEGMLVMEGAPVIGIALASPQPGSDTIPVFVTPR